MTRHRKKLALGLATAFLVYVFWPRDPGYYPVSGYVKDCGYDQTVYLSDKNPKRCLFFFAETTRYWVLLDGESRPVTVDGRNYIGAWLCAGKNREPKKFWKGLAIRNPRSEWLFMSELLPFEIRW